MAVGLSHPSESLYMCDPVGLLVAATANGSGMAVDKAEPGQALRVHSRATDTANLRLRLPQFARPGEERKPMRDLPFIHRLYTPEEPDGSTLILLHGTGGSETDLMPLAHRVAPCATLLGLRGRSTDEGVTRFFRRLTMTRFDQADIRSEAEAFAAFWQGAMLAYDLDPEQITVLGYSNGANFAGAVMALHPHLIRRAILIRPMLALDPVPEANLSGLRVLTLQGARDPYGAHAPALNDWLARSGADLDARVIAAGHEMTQADLKAASAWLAKA